eukprot:c8710_g1_i2.p1 GENE.c8710_g1_i2~~c8710_g1_i2.p1  ORF type:complete len:120 (-),score=26.07 c8710_g1_i2:258-584(-)
MTDQWSTGLCDCWGDCRLCCLVTWCGPCVIGQVASLLQTGDPGSFVGDTNTFLVIMLLGLSGFSIVIPFLTCTQRTKIRAKYNLPAQPCNDCCLHFFCGSCAIAQEWK